MFDPAYLKSSGTMKIAILFSGTLMLASLIAGCGNSKQTDPVASATPAASSTTAKEAQLTVTGPVDVRGKPINLDGRVYIRAVECRPVTSGHYAQPGFYDLIAYMPSGSVISGEAIYGEKHCGLIAGLINPALADLRRQENGRPDSYVQVQDLGCLPPSPDGSTQFRLGSLLNRDAYGPTVRYVQGTVPSPQSDLASDVCFRFDENFDKWIKDAPIANKYCEAHVEEASRSFPVFVVTSEDYSGNEHTVKWFRKYGGKRGFGDAAMQCLSYSDHARLPTREEFEALFVCFGKNGHNGRSYKSMMMTKIPLFNNAGGGNFWTTSEGPDWHGSATNWTYQRSEARPDMEFDSFPWGSADTTCVE